MVVMTILERSSNKELERTMCVLGRWRKRRCGELYSQGLVPGEIIKPSVKSREGREQATSQHQEEIASSPFKHHICPELGSMMNVLSWNYC